MIYLANPDVVYRPEGHDGAILFHPDTSQVHVINLSGAYIWEHLDGSRDLEALCVALAAQFSASPGVEALRAEVGRFIEGLVAIGFAAEARATPLTSAGQP